MKNKKNALYSLLIILAGATYFPVLAQQKNAAQTVIYHLDVKKSKLLWKAPKSLGNRHYGFIFFNSGTLSNFTTGRPTRGTFNINMNSIRSTDRPSAAGRKEVDDELRSEGFFAVSRYPNATMIIKQILPEHNPTTFRVYGDLTIKGVTNPIVFTTIMKQNGSTITATASMNINRVQWRIGNQPEPTGWNFLPRLKDGLIDDEISVSLELVFSKK